MSPACFKMPDAVTPCAGHAPGFERQDAVGRRVPLRTAMALLLTLALSACGGGGDAELPRQALGSGGGGPSPGALPWLATAAQFALDGSADSGIDGDLRVAPADGSRAIQVLTPPRALSATVRVYGGSVDATLGSLSGVAVRQVVYDAADPSPAAPVSGGAQAVGLFRLALGAQASAPVVQRLSTESQPCPGSGARFSVIGQSLAGDEAVLHYRAATAATPCAAGGEPRLVTLAMSDSDTPIALDAAADTRVQPVGAIHNGSGRIAAFLGWQGGRFVRTDATLRHAVALAPAELGGPVDAAAAPRGPGWVSRFGIFVLSGDGLRRYDKSTGRLSGILVSGTPGQGALITMLADEEALYLTVVDAAGATQLYRVPDAPTATATRLNVEGPLDSVGFRLTRSHVLYALQGRNDWTAWHKATGRREAVLPGRAIVLASTLGDTVFTTRGGAGGVEELMQGGVDGSGEQSLGAAQLVSGSLADVVPPFARVVRGNAAFSHALLAVPAPGATDLSRAALRWVPFDTTQAAIDAGTLPAALGAAWQTAALSGASALVSVAPAAGGAARLFTVRRAAGTLREVTPAP